MAKKGKQNGAERQHAPAVTDPRFARLQTDPRFLKPRRDDTKVVVDSRFKDIFASDGGKNKSRKGAATQGKGKARVDKYGRKLAPDASASELKRFYRLEDEADEKDGDLDARVASASSASGSDSGSGVDSDEDEGATKAGEKGFIDYARGEGDLESSGDEGLDSDEEEDSEEEDEGETDSDEEDGDVVLGPSHVVRREKQRRAAKEDDEDEFGEIDLDEDVDESAYAELDAQAAAAIRQGEAEDAGESSDEDLDVEAMQAAAVARGKAKGKEKASNKPRKQTMPRGDDTPRLAVVNMDWDHVRAKDLYKVFTSLVSPTAARLPGPAASVADSTGASSSRRPARQGGAAAQVRGSLLHVRVYPSDFGKERMEREDREGPPRDIFKKGSRRMRNGNSALVSEDEESEEEINEKTIVQVDEGGEFDEEALRKYQLERLRYYYAVATFDSAAAARHVYNEIDGTEMERTANVFDLRFVPEGMEFDTPWRDEATEDLGNYKPVDFKTDALRHSKVKLTWDADDPERERVTRQAARGLLTKDQLRDDDFRAYLASGTESEGEDDKTKGRDRLRALLHLDGNDDDEEEDEEDQGAGDLQITFMPGLSEAASRKARGEKKGDEEETTLEKYMRKQRERREKKKQSRSGKDDENEVEEDAGAGAISGGADAAGFNDPFFESDPEMDMEAALRAEEGGVSAQSAKKGKDKKKERKGKDKKGASEVQDAEEDPAAAARARAELELMVDSDSGDEAIGGRRHFDMKDIIRSEQGKDKKSRKRGKRGKAGAGEDDKGKGSKSARDDFQINTQDPRFAALHEDHRFAIDPSNPHFIKTNSMQKLLDERRRQQERKRGSNIAAPSEERKSSNGARNGASNNDLGALVQSIKKRAAAGQDPRGSGSGKKRRT